MRIADVGDLVELALDCHEAEVMLRRDGVQRIELWILVSAVLDEQPADLGVMRAAGADRGQGLIGRRGVARAAPWRGAM